MSEGGSSRLDIAAIIELLERVEELPDGATGSLMIQGGDSAGGMILVDDRQVCWIAANGMGRRLSDLLRAQATRTLSTEELEEIYASCRETKEPIGQALLARGLITELALVRALKRHSTESLVKLAQGSPEVTWIPRERGFAPRHSLSTATLLAEVGATARWGGIAPSLGWLVECGARGAAYARALGQKDGLLTPVAEVGMGELGARGLLELGSWTATSIEAVRRIEPEVPCAVFDDGRGHRCCGWHRGVLLHVAVCDDDIALSRILRRVYAT
jgi:hypothetical protein